VNASKHLAQMRLHYGRVACLTQHLQQVVITHEVKPGGWDVA
jgi:hypothetical protein